MVLPVFTSYPLGEGTKKSGIILRRPRSFLSDCAGGACRRHGGVSLPEEFSGEPFHFTAESATFVVHGKAGNTTGSIEWIRRGISNGSRSTNCVSIATSCGTISSNSARSTPAIWRRASVRWSWLRRSITFFDTPDDRLVWDVGHQAYAHKIITGAPRGVPHQT